MNLGRSARQRLVGVASVLGLAATLAACATRAPADSVILYYTAGAEDRHFKNCIEPGTSGDMPINDEIFALPTSLRTWNITPRGGDTDQPINAGTRPAPTLGPDGKPTGATQPGPEVNVWATADFYLNTSCRDGRSSPVVQFWEKTGRRYGVSEDGDEGFKLDRWREMLLNTFAPAEAKAIREETRNYSADDLDANTNDVWTALERQLGPAFNAALREKVGGDYFCGPGYDRGKAGRGEDVEWDEYVPDGLDVNGVAMFRTERRHGTCPPVRISIIDVAFVNKDIADARARVFTAEQNAKAALIDAQSKADVAARLEQVGQSTAYVELQRIQAQLEAAQACRANPNCTVIIDGTGNAAVTAGRR